MNYCKDCRFHRPAGGTGIWGASISWPEACACPGLQPWPRNLVTGEVDMGYLPPKQQRENEQACGFDGKWFQLKVEEPAPVEPDPAPQEIVAVQTPEHRLQEVPKRRRPWWHLVGVFG